MALPFQLSGLSISGGMTFSPPGGSPPPPPSNLILSYDFSDPNSYNGSGTTIYDLSGNGNNATMVNSPTFNPSDKGGSLTVVRTTSSSAAIQRFGTLSTVNFPYTTPGGGTAVMSDWSFSIVVNIGTVPQYNGGAIWNNGTWSPDSTPNSGAGALYLRSASNTNELYFPKSYPSGTSTTISTGGVIALYDFVYTSSNKTCILYVNGSQLATRTLINGYAATDRGFNFGAVWETNTNNWAQYYGANATYYQIKAYNQALDSTAITNNYNAIKSKYGI